MHSRQAFSAAVLILVTLVFPNLATAYYSPRQGRFISRDPIGEKGGRNLLSAMGNDPVNSIDVLGAWAQPDHNTITSEALTPGLVWVDDQAYTLCYEPVLKVLNEWNHKQDQGANFWQNQRHFNREPGADRAAGTGAYRAYLAAETSRFDAQVAKVTAKDLAPCEEALHHLGLLSHSWEDFFMHANAANGTFSPLWSASPPITGTPDNPGSLGPSSWALFGSSEHGVPGEPVARGTAEFDARMAAAKDFTAMKLAESLK